MISCRWDARAEIAKAVPWPRIARLAMLAPWIVALAALLPCHGAAAQSSGAGAAAADDATELAKKLQNPIADLISVPFQNNANFDYGPNHGTQNILNIQPVVPFHITENWNLITRTILPLVSQPSLQPGGGSTFGTGPTVFTAFLSPKETVNGWLWGVGPVFQIPTASSSKLGSNVWGGGPSAVAVRTDGPWVYGALINNIWSFGGTSGPGGSRYSVLTAQPFVNYNFGGGWFVGTSPIITANWYASGGKWTLPLGAQGGRLVKLFDKLPVNFSAGAYYNAIQPEVGPNWQLRTQVTFVF